MSRIGADKFRFVSPGVQTAEIDLSRRPGESPDAGPCIVGRFAKGPTMRPTVIQNSQELVQVFGEPNTGQGATDVSRYQQATSPSYAAYAAMAYLKNSSNCTIIRLVGKEYYQAAAAGAAGYSVGNASTEQGGAWGLFLIPSASGLNAGSVNVTGTLAAVWYVQEKGAVVLSGSMNNDTDAFTTNGQGQSVLFKSVGANARFKASVLSLATAGTATSNSVATPGAKSSDTDALNCNSVANNHVFSVQVPTNAGGNNSVIKIQIRDSISAAPSSDEIFVKRDGSNDVNTNANLILAINGSAGDTAKVKYGSATAGDDDNGVAGLTATPGASGKTTLEAGTAHLDGDSIAFADIAGTISAGANMTGGSTPSEYADDDTIVFDFDPSSDTFIRKVFNTNPTFTNNKVTDSSSANYKRYWLGPTYEDQVRRMFDTDNDGTDEVGAAAGDVYGVIFPLQNGTTKLGDFTYDAQPAKSGWIFGQDLSALTASYSPASMPKLFRFVTLEEAENVQRDIKISIANIKAAKDGIPGAEYGKFDVIVREFGDNDRDQKPIEVFTGCNMNPQSPNYIGKRIGDQRFVWSDLENRYRIMGGYPNVSKYVRVEMNPQAEEGALDAALIPFGFYGVPRLKAVPIKGSSTKVSDAIGGGESTMASDDGDSSDGVAWSWGQNTDAAQILMSSKTTGYLNKNLTASLEFPAHDLVQSASISWLADPRDRYFGLNVLRKGSNNVVDHSLFDTLSLKYRAKDLGGDSWDAGATEEVSNYFSLDDVRPEVNIGDGAAYASGSRAAGTSLSAGATQAATPCTDPDKASYQKVLDAGYDKFTLPLYGGFEGVDVTEREPIVNNRILDDARDANPNQRNVRSSYEYYTLKRAVDTVADAEVVDMNMLAIPGMRDDSITDHMINTCEARADALAVIDLKYAWTARHETTASADTVNAYGGGNTVSAVVTEMKNTRKINSSYACCYYPWVQVRDNRNGVNIWMPPSVVALGAMSYSQATNALWFAPAGFNRGGLSAGNAGLPVLQVSQRLSKKERDDLYEQNVNPIAQFPAEGIVIFGQKTMLQVPSALDRINVRRLLLFIKKRISRMASNILFDPNTRVTWNRFLNKATPFLESIVAGFGLEAFKIKLNSTTTTADLIDRNIMYAQIWIKPTKAIEYIALDFVITSQGASFDD